MQVIAPPLEPALVVDGVLLLLFFFLISCSIVCFPRLIRSASAC